LQLAAQMPDCHLIGFERRYKRLVKAARKLERAELHNVWLLREAAENFSHYFDPGGVDRVYINFPDPWPKAAQWKKRLINHELLSRLETALKAGGQLHIKTDHSGYFLHILSLLGQRPRWHIRQYSNDLHRYGPPGGNLRTEFEQLFASKNKPIFFLAAQFTGGQA
jgi:tRNA (guanine-N7-)-methyltransferase